MCRDSIELTGGGLSANIVGITVDAPSTPGERVGS